MVNTTKKTTEKKNEQKTTKLKNLTIEKNYNALAKRTETSDYSGKKFPQDSFNDFFHFAILSANMLDLFKKRFYYNREISNEKFEEILNQLKFNIQNIEVNKDKFLTNIETIEQYQPEILKTFSKQDNDLIRLLHASIGVMTEGGELVEALAEKEFNGKKLDLVNIAEENGDIDWYQAIVYNVTGQDEQKVRQINIDKLRKRYPDGFSDLKANERDLKEERKILEDIK